MITSIQVHSQVKEALTKYKKAGESYGDAIERLLQNHTKKENELIALQIEGCKEMAQDMLEISKEFEAIEEDWEYDWNPTRRHPVGRSRSR